MTPPLLADTVEVDPLSGLDIPTLWIVCIIAFFVFGLAALYLSVLRRGAYDEHAAWNYGVGMVLSGVISGIALVVVLKDIFNALSGLAGLVIIAVVLIYFGNPSGTLVAA